MGALEEVDVAEQAVKITFYSKSGEIKEFKVQPGQLLFGQVGDSGMKQWYVRAFDLESRDIKDFPVAQIMEWVPENSTVTVVGA